jgi:SAM-dependent methyltransferase
MNDALDGVRKHYHATGLVERVKGALAVFPEGQPLTHRQLSALDQFHSRGLEATADLARLAKIDASMSVLDIGAGVGGPARFLNETYGCRVTGVDLSEAFVEVARYLTERTGQSDKVSFQVGNALELPCGAGSFDAVFLQHVVMNIAARSRLYREIRRVLRPKGRFATFDVVLLSGEPDYPLPWARTPDASFLLTAEATRDAIEGAGFRAVTWQDDTALVKDWFAKMQASGPPPSPNLGVLMGPDTRQLLTNLARHLGQGKLGILTAIFEA